MENLDIPEIDHSQESAKELFHEKLRLNQILLRDVYDEDEFTDDFANSVIDELDSSCPYINKSVAMMGVAYVPEFNEEYSTIIGQSRQETVSYGLHLGVAIIMEDDGPVLTHQVKTDQINGFQQPTFKNTIDIFNCFIVNSSVTVISDIEDSFNPFYLSEYFDFEDPQSGLIILKFLSDEFAKMVNDTKFRRLTKSKQDNLIEQFIYESVIHSCLIEQEMSIKAQYGYTTFVDPIKFEPELKPISIGQRLIVGSCLTIDMLETTELRKNRITSDKSLIDKKAGLCLVLDLDDESKELLLLEEGQPLYLPVSSQKLDIELA